MRDYIDRDERRRRRRRKRKVQCFVRCTILVLILIMLIVFVAFGIKSCTSCHSKKGHVATSGEVNAEVNTEVIEESTEEPEEEKITVTYPDKSKMGEVSAEIKDPYVAILDVTENQLVAGRNEETRIYPASMTKVMTLIVAVEHLDSLDKKFTMTSEIIDPLYRDQASRAGFEPNEEITAKDLLYGLILPSGGDAAVGLAQLVAGSEEEFVKLMNEKCEEMGLKNTHFMNTSGLHNSDHYTTPTEQAMILEYAMQNETCAEVLSTYQYTTSSTEQHPEGILLTSTMFSRMYGNEVAGVTIQAGKTGYTQEAKHCLVSYATGGGKAYIAVTAGAEGRWDCIYDDFKIYEQYCEKDAAPAEEETESTTDLSS